ncbi:unnamed protein product [Vitrella brassicaformis CCMP3155]|uniref:Uncharacterized protein n=1 Tax=Vitrella brassicaformis (strain CCMP3155) TaxID=1169540 RepID=A0A0G4F6X9_VITBC|nr:unnamed protein product [Vitrella brassicaformis CCMP3155]|eukprot:CEM07773.1 unnamed protein product [Vitrella brassicaformis CCMP3155]
MASSLPDELWRGRVVRCLQLPDVIFLRKTSRAIGTSIITAALLVERIDGSLARHSLTGLIDIDRTAPLPFSYVLRAAYVLEQGNDEWPVMGRLIRLAAIHRLTPVNGLPLVLSAQWLTAHLPSRTAFHQLPLAMAIYWLFGHLLTHNTHSLALQQTSIQYRIGDESFRVVPLSELPGGHPYVDGYKRTDPAISWTGDLCPSFSTFLMRTLLGRAYAWAGEGVNDKRALCAVIGHYDPRYGRLMRTDDITEDLGIAVDYRFNRGDLNAANPREEGYVVVRGFRPGETVAACLWMGSGTIVLRTIEPSAADAPASLAHRFPISEPLWRRLLQRFVLDTDVIDKWMVRG